MNRALRLAPLAVGIRFTQVLIRTAGFRRTVRLLGSMPTRHSESHDGRIEPWVAAINAVSRRPRPPSCLDRSVFLWFIMRLHGFTGELRIGVSSSDGAIDGHAWVEYDGRVINDADDVRDRFAVFDGEPIGIAFL